MLFILSVIAVLQLVQLRTINTLQKQTSTLEENMVVVQQSADAALAAVIGADTIAKASNSVYMVVVNGSAKGTAFVIDRSNGLVATAAHVAEALPFNDPDAEIYLLNRSGGRRLTVIDRQAHIGFGAFRKIVENYQPIRKNSPVYSPQVTPLRDLAFDAALLKVNALDPDTGESTLGPPLPIATEQKLLSLKPGAPIAVIGYPYDTLDNGFAPDAAISRVERGVIAAMTPPLDNAAAPSDPVIANLIIHRLSTAGGNSGSPIIDAAGEVVGIHTHGIESASSNADGAAQRADVIYDLLDPVREQQRLDDIFIPAWRTMLNYWERAETALPWSFYIEYALPDKKRRPLVAEISTDLQQPFVSSVRRMNFEPAVDEKRVNADELAALDEKKASGFVIREKGEYAEAQFHVDRSKETVLFAFDYSLRSKLGFCPLKAYWRKRGATQLTVQRASASFELHLPPTPVGEKEEYQVIIKRTAGCDPLSSEFFVGDIAWDPTAAIEQVAFKGTRPGEEPFAPSLLNLPLRTPHSREVTSQCIWGLPLGRFVCEKPETIRLETFEYE